MFENASKILRQTGLGKQNLSCYPLILRADLLVAFHGTHIKALARHIAGMNGSLPAQPFEE